MGGGGGFFDSVGDVGEGIRDIATGWGGAVYGQTSELSSGFTGALAGGFKIGGNFFGDQYGIVANLIDKSGLDDVIPPLEWLENYAYLQEDILKNEILHQIAATIVVAYFTGEAISGAFAGAGATSTTATAASTTAAAGSEALTWTGSGLGYTPFEGLFASQTTYSLAQSYGSFQAGAYTFAEIAASNGTAFSDLYNAYKMFENIYSAYEAFTQSPNLMSVLDYSYENQATMPMRRYATENLLYEDDEELYYILKDFKGFINRMSGIEKPAEVIGEYGAKNIRQRLKKGNVRLNALKEIGGR